MKIGTNKPREAETFRIDNGKTDQYVVMHGGCFKLF